MRTVELVVVGRITTDRQLLWVEYKDIIFPKEPLFRCGGFEGTYPKVGLF